jgi:hypothetical protein
MQTFGLYRTCNNDGGEMKWTLLGALAALATACDLNEGPREESREAVEAARDGRSPEAVQEQVDDVSAASRGDRTAVERDLERDLRKAEEWVAEVRRDLASGAREADDRFERSFDAIEQDLKAARADYDRMSQRPESERQTMTDSLREKLRQLSLRVDALDGEVDDRPGPDPHGPG